MRYAVNYDLIMRNPVERVPKPHGAKDKDKRHALKTAQAARLLRTLREDEQQELERFHDKERRREQRGATYEERAQIYGISKIAYKILLC